ncbi:putative cell division cycle protein 123 [Elsinoe fawcettii]|nr:putative cell division cycle protein 123 [Elsinoe fawcettii]
MPTSKPPLVVPMDQPAPTTAPSSLPTSLPFPALTKSHILACSFPSWYPLFRSHTPKARLLPLPTEFTSYLRSDGILLPPSNPGTPPASSETVEDEGFFSSSAVSDTSSQTSTASISDPSLSWPDLHASLRTTISELGGAVVPKLNWSAPKDATWIVAGNSLECRTPNDVYLLLKSSDFVTHDLEHAFDDCVDWVPPTEEEKEAGIGRGEELEREIEYSLVLRKWFRLNPSLEFRVFVRGKKVLGIGQRDLNHFDFLFGLRGRLRKVILEFWKREVRERFEEENYTMDVYVPPPHERCWIVDFNPWDKRTDPGTWSWLELLTMEAPEQVWGGEREEDRMEEGVVRLKIADGVDRAQTGEDDKDTSGDEESEDDEVEDLYDTMGPEFRLVERDDPEAYMFNSTRYSAHKLPRDVVDASQSGAGGLREFAEQWKDILEKRVREDEAQASDGDDD